MDRKLLEKLDLQIASKSLLEHQFYQDWQLGRLTMDDLRLYGTQYWHFEKEFPRYLSSIHSQCPDSLTRTSILHNLWDEESGDKNHEAMWLDFCSGIGIPVEQIHTAPILPETSSLTDTYKTICSNQSFLDGVAIIYAYESQAPSVMNSKLTGLQKWYGINNEITTRFFSIHQEIDTTHSLNEQDILARHLTEETFERTEQATQFGLDSWWSFLDGVQRMRV